MVQHMYACVSVFVCLYIICVYLYTCAHVCRILTCGHGHIFHSYMPPGDARSHTSCNDPQGVLGPGSAPHPQNFQENSILQAGLSRNGWSERATWVISLGRLIVHAFNHVLVPIRTENWVQSGRWGANLDFKKIRFDRPVISKSMCPERATWVILVGRLVVHAFNHVLVPIWTENWIQSGRWLGCKPWFQENSLWQAGFKQEFVPRVAYMTYFSRALRRACFQWGLGTNSDRKLSPKLALGCKRKF